jgi:hypothetical protein
MELPLWAELVWRTVDGIDKDQEVDLLGGEDQCREEEKRKVVEKKHL